MNAIIILSFFVVVASGVEVKFKPCSGDYKPTSLIESVAIAPCDASPCKLHKGSTYEITVVMTPTHEITKLTTVIKAKIGLIWMPFPIKGSDACTGSNLSCPLKSGQKYTYKFSLPVLSVYPSLNVKVSWELKDQNDGDAVCFYIPLSVV